MPYRDPRELEKIRAMEAGAKLRSNIQNVVGAPATAAKALGLQAKEAVAPALAYTQGFLGVERNPATVDARTAGGQGPAVTPAEANLTPKPAPDINEPASRIGLYGSYTGPTSTSGMSDAEKAAFENQRQKDIAANVASLEGQTAAIRERRNALRASRGEPLVGENRYTGPAIAGNSRLAEYNQFRANNAASDIPSGLSRGRRARLALQADQLAAETALGQEQNRIADFAARSEDARGRAATASDLLSTQYDTQVDAANLANQQAKTAISGQDLIRKRQEFAAGAPTRQLATFEAINAGADLASETLNDRPILKETGVDAGGLYKQIAARVGDPAQANTLLQGFLTSVQERDKLARDAGKKPLDAEVLTLELEDFLGNL